MRIFIRNQITTKKNVGNGKKQKRNFEKLDESGAKKANQYVWERNQCNYKWNFLTRPGNAADANTQPFINKV